MSADVHLVADPDEADRCVADWRALAAASRGNLFVSPEWYFTWLAVAGDTCEPRLLLCEDAGELVGVLPLVQDRSWPRALRFPGDVSADRTAVVAAPGRPDVRNALLDAAFGATTSIFLLTHLDDEDVREPFPRGAHRVWGQAHHLPYARLDGGFDSYLAGRSRNFRADLKRKARSLAQAASVAYRRTVGAAELDADLADFFSLHDDRWNDRGGSSSSSRRARDFLRELARRTLASGTLRLWQLTADGRPIASLFGWSFGDAYSYYLAGFDRSFSRHSPGTLLLARTMEEASDEGRRRYDLLLGDESYKARFADAEDTVVSIVGARTRSSPAFLLAQAEAQARAALRRLPEGPRTTVQRRVARVGARLPLTRTR